MALENVGSNPGGGTPSPGAGESTPPGGQSHASGGGQQPVGSSPGGGTPGGAEKVYSFKEDRTDWVPRTRLNSDNPKFQERLTTAERRTQELEASLETERKRVRGLAGLDNPSDDEKQEHEVRALITKMFPQLEAFKDLTPQQLQQVLNAGSAAEDAAVRQWERHSAGVLGEIEAKVAKALGVEKLSERQTKAIQRAYVDEAQTAVNARFVTDGRGGMVPREGHDFTNDFMSRHERGDKTLIEEFAQSFVSDWFEPARRVATSQAVRRGLRPVPSGGRSGQVVTKAPDVNYSDDKAFREALIAARQDGAG